MSETWLVQEPCDLGTLADAMQVRPSTARLTCAWRWALLTAFDRESRGVTGGACAVVKASSTTFVA